MVHFTYTRQRYINLAITLKWLKFDANTEKLVYAHKAWD